MSPPVRQAPGHLPTLLDAITEARAQVELVRSSTSKLARARAGLRLRRAIESYAAALAQRGAPLPHRLRVELNIYRTLDQDP